MKKAIPEPIPYYLMKKIRQGVITGRYPPGSPLREQQLEAEYGTSRGPLREALRLLQLRGPPVQIDNARFRRELQWGLCARGRVDRADNAHRERAQRRGEGRGGRPVRGRVPVSL